MYVSETNKYDNKDEEDSTTPHVVSKRVMFSVGFIHKGSRNAVWEQGGKRFLLVRFTLSSTCSIVGTEVQRTTARVFTSALMHGPDVTANTSLALVL